MLGRTYCGTRSRHGAVRTMSTPTRRVLLDSAPGKGGNVYLFIRHHVGPMSLPAMKRYDRRWLSHPTRIDFKATRLPRNILGQKSGCAWTMGGGHESHMPAARATTVLRWLLWSLFAVDSFVSHTASVSWFCRGICLSITTVFL